ncbi:hypothetical protein KQX54_004250 [Cotesia glomerata]|uniref:Uncharacterized protein n=1 Tax=Cotesia glomerata TaxID=32391 RepID=A0AAV7IFN9_COTGL|nr:hypothetical protein KQX54_004250 [Cotesia glomerata]
MWWVSTGFGATSRLQAASKRFNADQSFMLEDPILAQSYRATGNTATSWMSELTGGTKSKSDGFYLFGNTVFAFTGTVLLVSTARLFFGVSVNLLVTISASEDGKVILKNNFPIVL